MNRRELKAKHTALSKTQPFTESENKTYTKKDQSMIRNIQILNNIDKKEAIDFLKEYGKTSKSQLKTVSKQTRQKIALLYSKEKAFIGGNIPEKRGTKPAGRKATLRKAEREKVQAYLKNPENKNNANYKKVQSASHKYLDASKFELTHGVNSKASQDYREKNGLNRKYEGRVIK